jgi:hypothetical protein
MVTEALFLTSPEHKNRQYARMNDSQVVSKELFSSFLALQNLRGGGGESWSKTSPQRATTLMPKFGQNKWQQCENI